MKNSIKVVFVCLLVTAGILSSACQTTTTTNTNSNANLNVNASPAANANVSPGEIAKIAAREPQLYKATLVLTVETEGGEKTVGIPQLTAEVARNGDDRRVAVKLPDGSDLIYLEKAGQHIAIAPARKQYAELTPEAIGVQLRDLMTPGQLVARLENLKGLERVGEETVNGRTAEKYRYARTANTNTQAGQVETETFVFVDKETGLPLRSELYAEATGNVQGVKGAKVVAEMRDISTQIDLTMFDIPAGYSKVPPEQVRQQINALTQMAGAVLKALLTSGSTATTSPSASPTVSPTR